MAEGADLRGAEAVVRALEAEEIPYTFGIPGTHNIELYDRLGRSEKVRPVLVTDEQSASFMADGLWRASGRLGCVNLVPGAGLTHALSGIAEAFLDHVPMLVLGCGIRRDLDLAFQLHDVDQLALARVVTKGAFRPARGSDIYATIRGACALARSGAPGPVMVEIPADQYLRPSHDPAVEGREPPPRPDAAPPREAWNDSVERAIELLHASHRPLLYLGLGAAGARDEIVQLAEHLEAPVATSLQGKGVFPESHPLSLWPGFGTAAPPFVRNVVRGCDATLAVGCRFAEVGTGSYGVQPPSPLIHVDIDPSVPGRNFAAAVPATADARGFVTALLEGLRAAGRSAEPDADLREAIRQGHERVRAEQLSATGGAGVTPALLLGALQSRLGPDCVFTTDSGNGTFLAAECLRLERPGLFLAPVDFSCMGYAVPAAIGAALGATGAPVVALAGDGAFLMTGLEMLTARQLDLPVAFLILRDRELAQIAQFQDTAYARKVCTELPDYGLVQLCQALGIECLVLGADEAVEEGVAGIAKCLAEGRPVAAEVTIDYSRKTYFTRGVVRTNLGRLPWPDRLRVVARALGRRIAG